MENFHLETPKLQTKPMKNYFIFAAIGSAFAASSLSHAASILYSSDVDFGKGTNGGGNLISVAGWAGVYGKAEAPAVNTTDAPFASTSGDYHIGLQDADNGTVDEYIYFRINSGGDGDMDFFAHTSSGSTFTSFAPDDYSAGLTATWQKNSGDSFGNYAVSVLVNGTWYAADSTSGNSAGFPVFDLLTAGWLDISDSPSGPLELGGTAVSSATLFSGETIDGFGFFATDLGAGRVVRLDNIVIEGVPEPSTGLLGLFGALVLLRRRVCR